MFRHMLYPLLAAALCADPAQAQERQPLCRAATSDETALFASGQTLSGVTSPQDGTCWVKDVTIVSHDGTALAANVFLPKGHEGPGRFPGIVMIGSWAAPGQVEYLGQQRRLAQGGYIVAAYTARGFYNSGGVIGVASPADVRDVSSVLDWMTASTPLDAANVAASGISYGGGLALMALAQDKRVKTAAAFSGWGNLMDDMYPAATANRTWSNVLNALGQATGRPDPVIDTYVRALNNPDTGAAAIAEITAWAKVRSPMTYVQAINQRSAPVFISHNLQDDMFSPNSALGLYGALTGPKKLLLNNGIHASAELAAATLGGGNVPYDQARRWFDYWLKGVANGVGNEARVSMQVRFSDRRDTFADWPARDIAEQTWYLSPRGALRFDLSCFCAKGDKGALSASANTVAGRDAIQNYGDTTATTGTLPLLSALWQANGLPVMTAMPTVALPLGVRYEGPAAASVQRIRGIPRLNLNVTPSQGRAQVVAYLYDVDAVGRAVLIAHGVRSLHTAVAGQAVALPVELSATVYDLPAGHHLGVVLDTTDPLYGPAVNAGERFGVTFEFSKALQSTLAVPLY